MNSLECRRDTVDIHVERRGANVQVPCINRAKDRQETSYGHLNNLSTVSVPITLARVIQGILPQ